MKTWVAVCLAVCLGVLTGRGQQPETPMKRRDQVAVKKDALPPPPAPLKAPETLEPSKLPNANAIYQALRLRTVNGAAFTVKDLTIKRDAAEITLTEGTVYLYGEVNGAATGAVFLGDGMMKLVPPSAMERRQLKYVMKTEMLAQKFTTAMFAFTDGTAGELAFGAVKQVAGSGEALALGKEMQTLFRDDLKYDLEERLMEDVGREGGTKGAGGFFLAVMKGSIFTKRLIYTVDPHGAIGVAPGGGGAADVGVWELRRCAGIWKRGAAEKGDGDGE